MFDFLDSHGIAYERVDHPPVFNCEQVRQFMPPISGAETKNLFLRDGKGRRHFLLSIPAAKSVDFKTLSSNLGIPGLGFASPERLKRYLDLAPGSVTLLGVVNDRSHEVEVWIDEEIWASEKILCHPLVNTSTLSVARGDLVKFFAITGHEPRIIAVPSR